MKKWKRALCLLLCLCMTGTAGITALAVELPDLSDSLESYDGLLDGVIDSLDGLKGDRDLQISDKLRGVIQKYDLDSFGADLKTFLETSGELSDEELADAISELAAGHGITLTDSQSEQLCRLCRKLEKLDAGELQDKLEDVRETVDKAEKDRQKISGILRTIRNIRDKVSGFLHRWLDRIKKEL